MANRIFNRIATEYVVHQDHPEVHGDVDSSIADHNSLLADDQNCLETANDVANLDSSNNGECKCNMCCDKRNRIAERIQNMDM